MKDETLAEIVTELKAANALWRDDNGVLHCDTVKMCEAMGLPPTEYNQETCGLLASDIIREAFPTIEVINTYDL